MVIGLKQTNGTFLNKLISLWRVFRDKLTDFRYKFHNILHAEISLTHGSSKNSLRKTIGLCFFLFAAFMLLVLWLMQTVFFDSFYKAIKTSDLTSCAESIEENISNPNLSSLINTVSQQNDTCITLYTVSDGKFDELYSADVNSVCVIHKLSTATLSVCYNDATSNGGTCVSLLQNTVSGTITFEDGTITSSDSDQFTGTEPSFDKENTQSLVYTTIIEDSGGDEYMLLLDAIITPLNSTLRLLRTQLLVLSVVFIILSVVLAFVVSNNIASPIASITNASKELAQGNYDVSFNEKGYKEIEELCDVLNNMEKELSQVDQMRKDLIANVSHDLRTPLTLITGYSEVMRDLPGENTPENVQIIIDEATRLKELVNDLIDISKIEAGNMKLEASVFNLTKSIEDMFDRYNKLKEKEGFVFQFEHSCDVYVYADELKISQVIYNLVNNAINYSGDSRHITVRQMCMEDRVRIEVIDNGPGIPADKLHNIWDRYYKVDKSHQSAKIGTGLGLSIVKSILKLHGAQFGVFSKLGKGSTFWFELQRTDENGEPFKY